MNKFKTVMKKYLIYVIFVVLFIVSSLISPSFATSKNLLNVARQLSVTGILAFAEMILIICGAVDLSLGSVLALGGMVSVNIYLATGSFVLAFLGAILVSMLCTATSGFVIAKFGLPAFVATLGMDFIARGAVYIYSGGQPIYTIGKFSLVSSNYLFGIPLPVIFLFAVWLICHIILSKTTLGRNIYAVGGSPEAAKASGISVFKTKITVFMIAGVLTGIAGVLQMARLKSGLPDTGIGYNGEGVAAAVIGGTSFTGGIGTATGTLIGAFINGILGNILNLNGVQSYVQQVVKGAIIIIAVTLDLYGKNRRVTKIAR